MEQVNLKGHILVLDEDQNVQTAVTGVLTDNGYRAASFQKTQDAMDALKKDSRYTARLIRTLESGFECAATIAMITLLKKTKNL